MNNEHKKQEIRNSLIQRLQYFKKHAESKESFVPEFEACKNVIDILTDQKSLSKHDCFKILAIVNEVENKDHYNGSGWHDFKIQLYYYISCHGFNANTMTPNAELIAKFYTAFQNKDYKTMQECYTDDATFSDPVFQNLDAAEVKAMWQMLITRATDLALEFKNVEADEKNGSAEWNATYTFTSTGKKVVNKIKAKFVFENGKIKEHKDDFDFYTWAKQALGFKGLLLGWTSFLHDKVKQQARNNLMKFMSK